MLIVLVGLLCVVGCFVWSRFALGLLRYGIWLVVIYLLLYYWLIWFDCYLA